MTTEKLPNWAVLLWNLQQPAANREPVTREEFLAALTDLSNATGWWIGGCGCCGSPWVWQRRPIGKRKYVTNESGGCLDPVWTELPKEAGE